MSWSEVKVLNDALGRYVNSDGTIEVKKILKNYTTTRIANPVTYSFLGGLQDIDGELYFFPQRLNPLYKFNFSSWQTTTPVQHLPYDYTTEARIYNLNGVIHIFNASSPENTGTSSDYKGRYKWTPENGFEALTSYPRELRNCTEGIYNGEIHIFDYISGTGGGHKELVYDAENDSYEILRGLPSNLGYGCALEFNDYFYVFCNTGIWYWNGTSWTSLALPDGATASDFKDCIGIVYNGKIHINTYSTNKYYTFDGENFVQLRTINGTAYNRTNSTFGIYKNKLLYTSYGTSNNSFVRMWDEATDTWETLSLVSVSSAAGVATLSNGKIYPQI